MGLLPSSFLQDILDCYVCIHGSASVVDATRRLDCVWKGLPGSIRLETTSWDVISSHAFFWVLA